MPVDKSVSPKELEASNPAWIGKGHLVGIVVVLLAGGGIGMLLPFIISRVLPGVVNIGGNIPMFGPVFWGLVIGAIIMALILLLRQHEFAATIVIAASIILDWYLHTFIVALLMALALLLIFFLARSSRYPWAVPRALWLWALFLVLTIFAAYRGALTIYEGVSYYSSITLGALIMFWLGTVIARSVASIRRFFKALTGFSALLAIHAIIEATTGKFLFWSSSNDSYLASQSYFILIHGLDIHRIETFFLNPDWAGTFFAFMLFIALGLFVSGESLLEKFLYLTEASLMVGALFFTYTYGAWIGACVGIIVLVVFVGDMRNRVQLSSVLLLFVVVLIVYFSVQVDLLQRRFDTNDALIRIGAWQTALRVINAFPMTGIGLGLNNYLERAEPYRVPTQFYPLAHPLNSYLELAAGGGLPILLVFVALLSFALCLALRNWARADARTRALLGGCIAAVFAWSSDSLTNNIWTLPPLAALGWVILGVISSPLLSRELDHRVAKDQNP
jgi:O-antigen ligase